MGDHTSIIGYFWQAGIVVKSVMLILMMASIASWALIFQRAWYFKHKKKQYEHFYHRFWHSRDLMELYDRMNKPDAEPEGLAAVFHAGFKEFLRLRKHGEVVLEPIFRMMQIVQAKETKHLEASLPVFASIGSISPYIGLFGTVWGIMTSIQSLGQVQQATIAMVAPGISEALVATAMGLFAAIPAVMAYNRYVTSANLLLNQSDLFQEELVSIIVQQTDKSTKGVQ